MGLAAFGRPRGAVTDLPWVTRYDQDIDTAPQSWAGARVSTDTAQQLLVVYGATAFHSDHKSTLPIDQYRKLPDGSRRQMPLEGWLDEPWSGLDITDALSQMWWSYWLGGHILAMVRRNDLGRVTGFLPVHPSAWTFTRDRRLLVNGSPVGGEFLSVPHVLVPGQWRGVNPIEAARQSIGAGLAAAEYGARFFGQGTTLSGVVTMPGPAPDTATLDAMRESWQRSYGGASRAHTPALLFGGAQWQQISVTPEQAQFLETRGFTDAQICAQLFQLPPTTLAVPMQSGGTVQYQNLEMAWSEVVRRWLPHLYRLKRAFSKLLPRPQYVEFNVDRYLAATTKERYETYSLGINAGILTPNEPRERENLPPLPGGDVPLVPAPPA